MLWMGAVDAGAVELGVCVWGFGCPDMWFDVGAVSNGVAWGVAAVTAVDPVELCAVIVGP